MISIKRISLLKRLALWALFKGAVSTHLASEILQEDEEETKALIDTYSKWFNSPEPGKYILYHDRLRTYFLQKLSSHELQSLNEKLISYLETALKDNIVDEAQEYALKYLAAHMGVESKLGNNYERLHNFVNNETLFEKQISHSRSYKWSQDAIQLAIMEACRYKNSDYLSKSVHNSVILYEKEQNQFDEIILYLDNEMFQIAFERIQRIQSLNQLKILVYIAIDFSFGSKNTHKSKDFVLNKVLILIKEYFSVVSNDLNWLSFIESKIMFSLCIEFQKLGFDLSFIFSNLIFSFIEIDECFLKENDYTVQLDFLKKIQINQVNALMEVEYNDFNRLIEDIEVVVSNLLFKFKKEIYALDIQSGQTKVLANINNDIKLINEKVSVVITDFVRINNTEENKFSEKRCTDSFIKLIISKYCELSNYLINSSEKSIIFKKENKFDSIIIKSYEIIIQHIDEIFYADNKIDCLSDIADYTIRNKNDDKLKYYYISYYNNFQSLNFKDKLFKIELLIKFCISNSKINNKSYFQDQLLNDLQDEMHYYSDKMSEDISSKERERFINSIYNLLIIYANELIKNEDLTKHDQILKISTQYFKNIHSKFVHYGDQQQQLLLKLWEIYLDYTNKKLDQDNVRGAINHLNSSLLYLIEMHDSINWETNFNSSIINKNLFDIALILFSNSIIRDYSQALKVLINNYIKLTSSFDFDEIFPEEILLKIFKKVDYAILSDFLLELNNIHISAKFIDIIQIDKLSETKLIDEFLDKLENTEKLTIETSLYLINLENKFTKSNFKSQYEILIGRCLQNCSYKLLNPKLNFPYLIGLINKIQFFEKSTKLNIKESLNLLKIKLIKDSNELLFNDNVDILKGMLNDFNNIGFSSYKSPAIIDSIDSFYSQTQNYSKEDCKELIRDNVASLINTILDSCFKTKSEIDFILTYHELEKLADKLGIQINKHNYNLAKDDLFDKLILQSFPYVLLSNVIENKFTFQEQSLYFDLAEDYQISYIISNCYDDIRGKYLKYLVPVEEQYQIAEHDFEYAMIHVRSDEFDFAFDRVNKIEEDSRRVKNLLLYYFVKIFIQKNQPNLIEKAMQLIDDNYFIGLSRIEIIFSNQLNEASLSLDNDIILFIKSLNYEWEKNSMINELILKSKKKENVQLLEKFKIEVVSRKYITECDYEEIENDYDFKSDDYYINFWSEGSYPGEIFESTVMDEHVEKRREIHFLSKTKKGKEKLKLMKVGLLSHKFGDSVSASYDIVLEDYDYCLNNTH